MPQPPDISVVFPTYNRGWVLHRTLEALRAQNASPGSFEVVVVDGGSTDGSVDAIKAQDGPVGFRLVPQTHGGRTAARNQGAAAARGRVLLFMDSDVWATPNLVSTHLAHHRDQRNIGVQGADLTHPDSLTNLFMRASNTWMPDLSPRPPEGLSPYLVRTRNFSVDAEAFHSVGGFDEGFSGYGWEDIELAFRLVRAGVVLQWEPAAVAHHYHVLTLEDACARQRENGRAAVYFWRKHDRSNGLGFFLEIHPVLLPLKWLVFRTGVLNAVLPPLRWFGERYEVRVVCSEVYNNLLWRSYYAGVFEALSLGERTA